MSPVSTTLLPGRPGPSTASGVITRPSSSVSGSPAWRIPRSRPGGTPSASAAATSKRPGPLVLDERVADGGDAVVDRERVDAVLPALERVARLELDERQPVRQPPEERPQLAEEVLRALSARGP